MTKTNVFLAKPQPKLDPLTILGVIAGAIVLSLIVTAISAVGTMIIFNVIHFNVAALSGVPAFGYWDSFVLTYAVSWVGFLLNGPARTNKS